MHVNKLIKKWKHKKNNEKQTKLESIFPFPLLISAAQKPEHLTKVKSHA
jgi:hypothetical protein